MCSPSQSPSPPLEVELGKPWLVQEPFEWCKAGKDGNLLVAPQHELSVYLSEVSLWQELLTIQILDSLFASGNMFAF